MDYVLLAYLEVVMAYLEVVLAYLEVVLAYLEVVMVVPSVRLVFLEVLVSCHQSWYRFGLRKLALLSEHLLAVVEGWRFLVHTTGHTALL